MHSLLDGATLGDLSSQAHGSTAGQTSAKDDIRTAVTIDAISLADDVVGNRSGHAQAVEHPVGVVELVPGRGKGTGGAAQGIDAVAISGAEEASFPVRHV